MLKIFCDKCGVYHGTCCPSSQAIAAAPPCWEGETPGEPQGSSLPSLPSVKNPAPAGSGTSAFSLQPSALSDSLTPFEQAHVEFVDRKLGRQSPSNILAKLTVEFAELIEAAHDRRHAATIEEAADMALVLTYLLGTAGISLQAAMHAKFKINQTRRTIKKR